MCAQAFGAPGVHRHPLGAPPSADPTCADHVSFRADDARCPVKATKELAAVQICGPASPQ
eukprot:scaffold54094_cov73-Phaeocystis_antarctica.AAC.1